MHDLFTIFLKIIDILRILNRLQNKCFGFVWFFWAKTNQ